MTPMVKKGPVPGMNVNLTTTQHKNKDRSPLEIFPEEIWLMIFNHLEDDDDIVRCYYTCPLFQSLLEVKMRGKALFIVNSYLHKYLIKRYFTHTDVMNLRLVSKSWQRSVDYYFQHDQREYTTSHVFPAIRFSSVNLRAAEQLAQSITTQCRSNRQTNPFVSRRLMIRADFGYMSRFPSSTMDPAFLSLVQEFVSLFGKHFWHLRFYAEITVANAVSCFHFLYQCLSLLPNLKSLSLETSSPRFYGPRGTCNFDGDDIKEFVLCHTFPKLHHLTLLSIKDVAICLVRGALEANNHVKNVDLFCGCGFPFNLGDVQMDRLSELYIYLHNIPDDMIKLTKVKWPLQTLTIQYNRSVMNGRSSSDDDEATVEEVRAILFQTVQNFGNSLTTLRLDIDFPCHPNWRLCLPKLEELSVSFDNFAILDFILPLNSLKKLNLEMFSDEYRKHHLSEVIQLQDMADCLQSSNIWNLMPKLQTVVIDLVGSRTCIKPLGRTGSRIGSRTTRSKYKIYTYHRWLNNEIIVQVE